MSINNFSKVTNKNLLNFCETLLFSSIAYHTMKGSEKLVYKKPVILAQGKAQMAECRPNSKPSGRPCNPPRPSGR